MSESRGITLIILIITIVVLIILAGVTISNITSDDGVLKEATHEHDEATIANEKQIISNAVITATNEDKYGELTESNLRTALNKFASNISSLSQNGPWQVTSEKTGIEYLIKQSYDVIPMSENIGTRTEMNVQVGDFVNYDAGTWTQEEIDEMGNLYSGETIPDANNPYTFGGFKVGQSKNNGIIKGSNNVAEIDENHSGWRVLKINDDGSINIIHAGCPEWYYQPQNYGSGTSNEKASRSAARSQFIFGRGKIDGIDESAYKDVEPRTWNMYENLSFVIQNYAHSAYFAETKAITGSEGTTSNTLRNIGINYFLANGYTPAGTLRWVNTTGSQSDSGGRNTSAGVRPVLTIKPECLFQNVNDENTTTHNKPETAWNLVI
ncbi:MAG: hypothetical protein J5881_03150 [Clostridia bacterium]|nr:hypothetical protein [Clostridia bacterium]